MLYLYLWSRYSAHFEPLSGHIFVNRMQIVISTNFWGVLLDLFISFIELSPNKQNYQWCNSFSVNSKLFSDTYFGLKPVLDFPSKVLCLNSMFISCAGRFSLKSANSHFPDWSAGTQWF